MLLLQRFCIIFLYSLLCMKLSYAGVLLTGTRVVFEPENKEKNLQFTNTGDIPYLVQAWLDKGDDHSAPQTADAPFIVNPQVFRINPKTGQMVRLVYTGDGQLPQDRETIFYLNFEQIPAIAKSTMDQNKLVLTVKSRLKVFYRPKTITGKINDLPRQLTASLQQDQQGSWIQVNNPTGYYANLTEATLQLGTQQLKVNDVAMIAPKSTGKWQLEHKVGATQQGTLNVTFINDYGAAEKQAIPLQTLP